MRFIIRRAVEADQPVIKALVRGARLGPFGLDWPRFLIAEQDGEIVGVGQVRLHTDSSRELASLVVVPEQRGKGIGSQLVRALSETVNGELYLMCREGLAGYYQRFGFQIAAPDSLPPVLKRRLRLVNSLLGLAKRLNGQRRQVVVMQRV